eukprot:COSAG01_NODE_888_length_12915_cov_10.708723_15_plen_269_part_00
MQRDLDDMQRADDMEQRKRQRAAERAAPADWQLIERRRFLSVQTKQFLAKRQSNRRHDQLQQEEEEESRIEELIEERGARVMRCVCGNFDWGFPIQRLFLSQNIEHWTWSEEMLFKDRQDEWLLRQWHDARAGGVDESVVHDQLLKQQEQHKEGGQEEEAASRIAQEVNAECIDATRHKRQLRGQIRQLRRQMRQLLPGARAWAQRAAAERRKRFSAKALKRRLNTRALQLEVRAKRSEAQALRLEAQADRSEAQSLRSNAQALPGRW